jgi:DNA-binding PucR family transcriptional regulator
LRIYLAFGRSRARAAERLHIARNTVAYRVEKATRMLDRPITEDPLKVRLALEISRVLPRLAGEAEPDSVPERPD